MDEKLKQDTKLLQDLIDDSDNIVFFGGAGVSTESGIPDFRSVDGLYHQKYKYPPESIISHSFFVEETEEFYRFYKDRMLLLDKEPNAAHLFLTQLEQKGKLKAIITQNIDGLHQKANSKNVIELHGSIQRNYCVKCHQFYSAEYVKEDKDYIPICPSCGGIIKPDVVLYEESLNEEDINKAIHYISSADLLIVAGTSLVVYPAASFISYFRGRHLVLINKDNTIRPDNADIIINQKIGELFKGLKA